MNATQTATAANESRYQSGVSNDYSLESELADFAESEAAEQEAEDERQAVNAKLFDWFYGG